MTKAKTVTVYHPDTAAPREVEANMKDRYLAAGWKATKPKGQDAPASE